MNQADGRVRHTALAPNLGQRRTISQKAQYLLAPEGRHTALVMLLSASVCLVGYTLFYARNADTQTWYTANLIVPVLLLILGILEFITSFIREKAMGFFSLLFGATVIFNLAQLYPVNTTSAPWLHQKYLLEAGVYLQENLPDSRIGAWPTKDV